MEGDRPLLLKLTVNLTPFGTMILIPGYWSFDPKRDLNWKAITALHRARGVQRYGSEETGITWTFQGRMGVGQASPRFRE
jgi:hypothetical protein